MKPHRHPLTLSLACLVALSFTPLAVAASAPTGWNAGDIPAWPSPVNPDAIVIEGETDIRWMPEPFRFEAGKSVRYIDFESGDDNAPGTSPDKAWKHHPWDSAATGVAATGGGVHTYVFKGGVTYRGQLVGKDSGEPGNPIRLTRDPSWGDGPAILAGSEPVVGPWTKVSADEVKSAGLPEEGAGKIWTAPLKTSVEPWALWATDADGKNIRQTLARWPNWKIEHPYNHFTQWFRVASSDKAFPRTKITADVLKGFDAKAFQGATIWIDQPNKSEEFSIMGPTSSSVGAYNPQEGSLSPELNHPARSPAPNSPFFLENKAWFLDEAGEWYYAKEAGRIYFWPPEGTDPNQSDVTVAQRTITIDLQSVQNVEISGLTFTGGNSIDPKTAVDVGDYNIPLHEAVMPAIRLTGDCRSVRIRNITVTESAGGAIANLVTSKDDIVSDIWITDSEFTFLDNDGISLNRGFTWRRTEKFPKARLTNLHILRNRLYDIGRRGMSQSSAGKAINLEGPEVADIAGNVIEYVAAHGINIHGGRPMSGWMGEDAPHTPLIRIQVRQNKVRDALLYKTDFGNIEFWQTGPAYIYNNISINPIGYVAHRKQYHKNEAFYCDHGVKVALFNNIGWSDLREDAYKGMIGNSFYKDVRTHWNTLFQNSSLNFRTHYAHEGASGDQQQILGNLMINSVGFISYWRLAEAEEIAFSRNLFAGPYENIFKRWRGETFQTVELFRETISKTGNVISTDVGWVSDEIPIVSTEKPDFRPTDNSPAIDRGVKVFVPWSLYGTVGEWNFFLQPGKPNQVLSYDLYPQEFLSSHGIIYLGGEMPDNRLEGEGFSASDYIAGVLEDWTEAGALRFDGSKTLKLPHARLIKDFTFKGRREEVTVKGTDRRTVEMQDNNFTIEAVLKRSSDCGDAEVASKQDSTAGYALGLTADGKPRITLASAGKSSTYVAGTSLPPDVWHHVVAEVDRRNGKTVFYINGTASPAAVQGAAITPDASLANSADFVVGKGLKGALEFLRVSRGTLAEAETTIEELMSWQFNGPHLHDFVGRAPVGERRDIGAIEHPTASGAKPVKYTPPAPTAPEPGATATKAATEATDEFLTGADRTVTPTAWCSISTPKSATPGGTALVQVAFPTETIASPMILSMDIHGFINGSRKTGMGRAAPIKVAPGVTTPYSASLTIPSTPGLERAVVVIYVSPDGKWATKQFSTEVSIPVSKN